MQKILLLLFIILFSSIYAFASSSDARKVEKKLSEYNDIDFKNHFKSYCSDFKENIKSSYIDRYYNILMSSGTDKEVYDFVSDCIISRIDGQSVDYIYFLKIIEDNYSKLIRKYYRYYFTNVGEYGNGEDFPQDNEENNFLKIFYNQLNQADIKIYCNYITSNKYLINPISFKRLDILREKINNEDMKKISLKLEKDIEIYAKRQYDDIQQSLMYQIEKSGILDNNFTRQTINKYYKANIKYSTVLKHTKIYYNHSLTNQYPELAKVIQQHINLKEFNKEVDVVDIVWDSLWESDMEIHHEDAHVTYAYKLKTPLKIKGIFTLSNINNNVYTSGSKYLNNYLPKTEFSSYDKGFEIKGISIRPKKFTYGSNIYPNILSSGILGEVNFDAEITIKPSSKIVLSRNPEENMLVIYIDEVKLNKIISSVKYNRNEYGDNQNSEYKDKQHNIDAYKLTSSDGYVNVRSSPNGKVIKKINLNSSEDYIVYYYKGLYNFKELEGILYIEEIAREFKNNAKNYYNQINKLLNMQGMNVGNWYKVVYFPKNTYKIDDAVIGYIHSSQMEKIKNSEEY